MFFILITLALVFVLLAFMRLYSYCDRRFWIFLSWWWWWW